MKRSKALLVSAVLSTLYVLYLLWYFYLNGAGADASTAQQIGAGIASALVTPHIVLALIGVIFNWLGWFKNLSWAALVSGILYSVSAVLFFMYAFFLVIQIVLSFVGFAKLRKETNA